MISRLEALDIRLSAEGERLRVDARKGALSEPLRAEIARSKDEILAFLRRGSAQASVHARIPRTFDDQPVPLSFAQERLWFLQQLRPDSAVYNLGRVQRIGGGLDLRALRWSLGELARRHDSLRSIFAAVEGRPLQTAAPAGEIALTPVDLRKVPDKARDLEARRLINAEMNRPFDLTQGRLLRVGLLRLRDDEHILALTTHHIAADAWSMGILMGELWTLYEGYSSGKTRPLAALPWRYRDYAVWQRARADGARRADLEYWKGKLAGLAALDLPTDRARPAEPDFSGGKVAVELPAALTRALNQLSRREGATCFMTLLAAFQILLCRWSGQDDIAVGAPIANRESSELEGIVGLFVGTAVLRTDLSGAPSFRALLKRARQVCLGAYAHQAAPFELLVQEINPPRAFERHPLFQSMLVLQNAPAAAPSSPPGLTLSPWEIDSETAQFELTLYLRERVGRLIGYFEYAADLFDRSTVERMAGQFRNLLESIVADPDRSIAALPLLSSAERTRLLVEWNDTAAPRPEPTAIHRLFEAQCRRTPDGVALECGDEKMSYGELNARANRLARELRERGIRQERIVGLLAERSLACVVSILAVLKAGGAYLPLDPEYPKERVSFMLKDAKVRLLLAQEKFAGALTGHRSKIVLIDDLLRRPPGGAADLRESVEGGSAAYLMYTSGSTGTPKGVVAPHRGALNRCAWMWKAYPFGRQEKICQKTSLSFVDSVWELFGALLRGIPTVLLPDAIVRDPRLLAAQIAERGVTRLVLVPSLLQQMLECGAGLSGRLAGLKYCFSSGEVLPADLARCFRAALPSCRLINLYGSSEVAGDVTCHEVDGGDGGAGVPIGRPIANTQVYLLDGHRELVPIGARGELYIGGDNLARGYFRRPALTAERFVDNPFGAKGSRLYRSGDLARYRADGVIEFLGRTDHQVKIRGVRVEPGEIEATLRRHPAVRGCVAMVRRAGGSPPLNGPGTDQLTAYVVTKRAAPASAELRSFLQERLPRAMLPSAFVFVESLPWLPNGKIDALALPPPDEAAPGAARAVTAPRTEIEALIAAAWRDVLKAEKLDINDNFFELGGHSLLAAQLAAKLSAVFDRPVPLRDIFDAPTVAGLARIFEKVFQEPGGGTLPPVRPLDGKLELPLSLGQEPLFVFSQLFGGGDFLNLPYAYRLSGKLDVAAMHRTISEIVRRHAVLRAGFRETAEGPRQFLRPGRGVKVGFVDLSALPGKRREEKLDQISQRDAAQVFDLEKPPLARFKLVRLDEAEHILLVTMHHIISDQWSMGVLRRELAVIYGAFSTARPAPLPDLPIQFSDFARWQRQGLSGGLFNRQISYWQKQLGRAPAALRFGRKKNYKPARFHSARRPIDFDAALFGRLKTLARAQNCTPFMVLVAALGILLQRDCGSRDIRIGTLVANRGQTGTDNLIGYFVNALVLRVSLRPDLTGIEVIRQVRETCVAAYMHADAPFEHLETALGDKSGKRQPLLYQVLLNYRNQSSPALEANGLTIASWSGKHRANDPGMAISRLDVNFHLRELPTRLTGAVNYKTDLFDEAAIGRLVESYVRVVRHMTEHFYQPISEFPVS